MKMERVLAGQSWAQATGLNGWELTVVVIAICCVVIFWLYMIFR